MWFYRTHTQNMQHPLPALFLIAGLQELKIAPKTIDNASCTANLQSLSVLEGKRGSLASHYLRRELRDFYRSLSCYPLLRFPGFGAVVSLLLLFCHFLFFLKIIDTVVHLKCMRIVIRHHVPDKLFPVSMSYSSLHLLHPFSCLSAITSGSSFFKQPCLSQANKWKIQHHILELRIPKNPQLAWISMQGFERRGIQEDITACSLSRDQIILIQELNTRTLNSLKRKKQ